MVSTDDNLSGPSGDVDSGSVFSETNNPVLENIARIRTLRKQKQLNDSSKVVQHLRLNPVSVINPITKQQLGEWLKDTGTINIQHASKPFIGQQKNYNGPVTIQQFFGANTSQPAINTRNNFQQSRRRAGVDNNMGYYNESSEICTESDGDNRQGNININRQTSQSDELIQTPLLAKRPVFFGVLFITLVSFVTNIILIVVYVSESDTYRINGRSVGDGDDSRLNIPINSTIGNDIVSQNAGNLRIVARGEWLAQPPNSDLPDLELPSLRVIIAHTATEGCVTQAECVFRVRMIQTFHMESRGWDDIGYSFLVGGDGAVYIGRGWKKLGAHTKGYNERSICIAFIGTFTTIRPPERQLLAAQRLIQEGVKIKQLDPNYRLLGHRQLMGTESPGAALYEIMKQTWPNWSNNTEI